MATRPAPGRGATAHDGPCSGENAVTAAGLLGRMVKRLDDAGIPCMLTGSFASSYHGRPRATQDIDLVIAPSAEQLRALLRGLPVAEFYADEGAALEALAHESLFNVIDLLTGWKVDLICRKSRPFSRGEFARRQLTTVEGLSLHVATLEDVMLAKLEWAKLGGSARQLEDVAALIRIRREDLDRPYLATWIEALDIAAEWAEAERLAGLPGRGGPTG